MSQLNNLKNSNFKFNKSYGQNFIFDTNLLQAISNDAKITNTTNVLEIGAGAGTLTNVLCSNAKKVVSYEIDKNLQPVLSENLASHNNLTLIFADILKQNVTEIEKHFNNEEYVMVANLPYYITTPIIFKFVEEANHLTKMVVMVQKEVAERITSTTGTKNYGLITVSLNAIADTKIARIVKRNMFTPAPNVDSAIITITFNKNKHNIENYDLFKKVIKSAFAMRRKTLVNNLKATFSLDNIALENLLSSCNLNANVRGESLTILEFVNLSNKLNKLIAK